LDTAISDGLLAPVKPAGAVDFFSYQHKTKKQKKQKKQKNKKTTAKTKNKKPHKLNKQTLDTVSITFSVPVLRSTEHTFSNINQMAIIAYGTHT
jgi:hypothetical protein